MKASNTGSPGAERRGRRQPFAASAENREKIYKNSEKCALAGSLRSRDEVDPVVEEVRKRGSFDSRGLKECVRFGNGSAEVERLKQLR